MANTKQSGNYSQLIDIERAQTPTETGGGGYEIEFLPQHIGVWSQVRPLSGQRILQFQNVQFSEASEFRIRANFDVLHTDRIVYKNKYWTIQNIINEGEDDWTLLILAYTDQSLQIA